jgi:hypothetical protein
MISVWAIAWPVLGSVPDRAALNSPQHRATPLRRASTTISRAPTSRVRSCQLPASRPLALGTCMVVPGVGLLGCRPASSRPDPRCAGCRTSPFRVAVGSPKFNRRRGSAQHHWIGLGAPSRARIGAPMGGSTVLFLARPRIASPKRVGSPRTRLTSRGKCAEAERTHFGPFARPQHLLRDADRGNVPALVLAHRPASGPRGSRPLLGVGASRTREFDSIEIEGGLRPPGRCRGPRELAPPIVEEETVPV